MIAVARSGNNNLCHIVTPNHGKKTGSATPFLIFAPTARIAPTANKPFPRKRRTLVRSIATSLQNPFPFWRVGAMLLFFHHALQGMLVLARKIHHLGHLGLGDLVGEHAALPDPMMMDMKHDLGRGFDVLLKELL